MLVYKDTDLLILMVNAYAELRHVCDWLMKIDEGKFVNIRKIAEHFGQDISLHLLHLHSLTGCDTSYFYGVGKNSL